MENQSAATGNCIQGTISTKEEGNVLRKQGKYADEDADEMVEVLLVPMPRTENRMPAGPPWEGSAEQIIQGIPSSPSCRL